MKRRQFLKAAGVGLAASTAVAAPAIAQSMPTIKWRMPTSWPKSLDTIYGGADMMCQGASAEATDGKFQIQVFAAGEIVPGLQIVDAVQNGTVEMRPHRLVLLLRQGPDVCASAPRCAFGPNARAEPGLVHGRRRQGSAQRVLQEIQLHRLARRQHRLPDGRLVPQGDQHHRRPQGPEDADRRLCRQACCRSSASCRSRSPAGDIYPALEKGTIDAAEWVGPYDDEKLGFYKVAPHYYYPGWWEGGSMLFAFVNLDKWNELPKHYQSILEQAGHYANT